MLVSLMVSGQEDVTWNDWLALARAAEESGVEGLFRSDHYLGDEREVGDDVEPRSAGGSLDAWTTLAGLAAVTERIRLGSLVSPVTFRHPSLLAKAVTTVDHISGGRAEVGIGAGWSAPEHAAYGFPFPPINDRIDMLAEQLEILRGHWAEGVFDFDGKWNQVRGLDARPKPVASRPTLIVGGFGRPRSLTVAARFADEYNTVYLSAEGCAALRQRASSACGLVGRDPATLRLSLMTGCVVGANRADVLERARVALDKYEPAGNLEAWLASVGDTWIVGTVDEAAARLVALERAGVDRVMLRLPVHRDLDMVRLIGKELAQ